MRVMGRAAFLDLRDASGVVQAMLRQNVLGDGMRSCRTLIWAISSGWTAT